MNGTNTRQTSLASAPVWKAPKGLRGRATCAVDLLADASKPPRFVIEKIAEAGDVMLVTGAPKISQKTMLAVWLVLARIFGHDWLGFEVKRGKPKRALFISTETRGRVLVRRVISQCMGKGADAAIAAKYIYIIDQPVTMISKGTRDRAYEAAYLSARVAAAKIPEKEYERKEALAKSADALGEQAVRALGQNVDLLDVIAVPDTWSIIIIDTLRQCLSGDENTSEDTAEFMAAARELARACGCIVVVIHHSKKGGSQSDASSSRGNGEIIGAPDVLVNIDATGEHPTAHFLLRNHESPMPVGYSFNKTDNDGLQLVLRAACAGSTKNGISEDDVLRVFEKYKTHGLAVSKVRSLVARLRGGKRDAKASPKTVQKHIDVLVQRGAISACTIVPQKGKAFDGYRFGAAGGRVPATKIDEEAIDGFDLTAFGDPTDV